MLDSERDLRWRDVVAKAASAPTLFVLPKWRRGMRLTARAHPDFLIPDTALAQLATDLMGPAARLTTARAAGFETLSLDFDGTRYAATLYAPRTALAPACLTILGTAQSSLLLQCPGLQEGAPPVFILTDPDLLNNHGLSLGENAALAAALLPALAASGEAEEAAILIDYADTDWVRAPAQTAAEPRTWDQRLAFFAWPYTLIWLGLGAALALAIWRGAVRAGPAEAQDAPHTVAPIEAEARLLALSGEGGRLLADYADQRMTALAHRLLGARAGAAHLATILPRRAPHSGPALLQAAHALHSLPAALPPETVQARMRDFETLIARVIHEFD